MAHVPDFGRPRRIVEISHKLGNVLADANKSLVGAAGVFHNAASTSGRDTAAPTTVLIDREGRVHWLFRPAGVFQRLSPAELLAAVDTHLNNSTPEHE